MSNYILHYRNDRHQLKELYYTQFNQDISICTIDKFDWFSLISDTHEIIAECSVVVNKSNYFQINDVEVFGENYETENNCYEQLIEGVMYHLLRMQKISDVKGVVVRAINQTNKHRYLKNIFMKFGNVSIERGGKATLFVYTF